MKTIILILGLLFLVLAIPFPSYVVVGGHEFMMPQWVTTHACPNGHTDVEFVAADLINDTMTITVQCKTCGVIFFNAFINQETTAASKGQVFKPQPEQSNEKTHHHSSP